MGEGTAETVALERHGAAAVVRLQRPEKLNAFTLAMVRDIRAKVMEAADDPDVIGIVVTGAGRGFCAGLDSVDLERASSGGPTSEPGTEPRSGSAPPTDELPALFSFILDVPKPVIAAVNGVAAGGGFVLAMMCDLRFFSTAASFTTAFSKRGLVAEHATSWLLPRQVGSGRALDLLWSARKVDAEEAYRIGFADRLLAPEDLLPAALAYVEELAATVSPRSLALMKAQVLDGWSQPIGEALALVDRQVQQALAHPDAIEGVRSFVERRPPAFARWRGADLRALAGDHVE